MILRRVAASGLILVGMSGCSHLIGVPAQYAHLPVAARDAAYPAVVIPGQITATRFDERRPGVEPTAALRGAQLARASWKPLRPDELATPPLAGKLQNPSAVAQTAEPATTASVSRSNTNKKADPTVVQMNDSEIVMNRLMKSGQDAAQPICRGC
ncbi:hypothetical protein [Methylobacterium nigriterrae]|uniref:hypothetical protein n=1 Tax=Methylobacterium nigriterrae TaxID=3127512 RepID=UPI0030138E16